MRESGFGTGNDQSTRSEGYRVARSNKVNQLLALAAAEAGGGYDGTLSKPEARSILTAMARGSNPQVRIKSIELLNKLEREEAEINNAKTEETLEETLAAIIAAVRESAVGAFLAMSAFHSSAGNLVNFPFIRQCAPVVAKTYPAEWAHWRSKHREDWRSFLDEMAKGPLLEGDELNRAVKAKVPTIENIVRLKDAS